jgi:hypothetical protein
VPDAKQRVIARYAQGHPPEMDAAVCEKSASANLLWSKSWTSGSAALWHPETTENETIPIASIDRTLWRDCSENDDHDAAGWKPPRAGRKGPIRHAQPNHPVQLLLGDAPPSGPGR